RSIPVTPLGYRHWMAREAPPFRAGIAAGAEVVMFGHLTYSSVDQQPASLSPVWHDILRSKLGFTGVTITDDMLMLQHSGRPEYADPVENAIEALAAGNTMLLYVLPADPAAEGVDISRLISGIAGAVESGRLDPAQIDSAAYRLLLLRRQLS
ncbi:MAG: glycoside hydrolase family 3 protein, partial [Ramlibacter sp.]|nr:glycoside hydrolase family 3 protein [Cryobacterium sp.]